VVVCIGLYVHCADCSVNVCYGCYEEKQFAIYSPAFLDPLPRSVHSFMRVRSSSSGNKNGQLLGCRRSFSPHTLVAPFASTKPNFSHPSRRYNIIGLGAQRQLRGNRPPISRCSSTSSRLLLVRYPFGDWQLNA